MSRTAYEVLNGSQPVTNLTNVDMTDLDAVKTLAEKVSAELGEDSVISVVSHWVPTDGGVPMSEISAVAATFVEGEEVDPDDPFGHEAAAEDLRPYLDPHFPQD